jgi:ketosteroid isomerase-like protein
MLDDDAEQLALSRTLDACEMLIEVDPATALIEVQHAESLEVGAAITLLCDRANLSPVSFEQFVSGFTEAFAEGDPAHLVAVLAPDAVLWHNNDGVEMDAVTAAGGITALASRVDNLHVHVSEGAATGNRGYVRFTVRGTVRGTHRELAARNCVFVEFASDGSVTRMDEYVDPTFSSQLGL